MARTKKTRRRSPSSADVAKRGRPGRPRGKRPPAIEATRRATIIFRGAVRRWPDERTAAAAGVAVRTVRRYRAHLRGGLRFILDQDYLRSRAAERFLELEDIRGEAIERYEGTRDPMVGARLLSVRIYAVRAEVSLLRLFGAFDKPGQPGERLDPAALQEFVKLPLERRRAEAAKRIELLKERLDPERYRQKVALLEAKTDEPDGE